MRISVRLGSLFGVSILAHYSWLVIFALVTLSLVSDYAEKFPQLSSSVHWGMGTITSICFFGSVLFHEFAHSLTAIWQGIKVRSITLFIFGGVSEIEGEPKGPASEILIAAVGPCASFLLGAVFGAIWFVTNGFVPVISHLAGWLATINVSLGIFNLLPGLPLDGGRILRGVIWHLTGEVARSTRIASEFGRFLGYLILAAGAWLGFTGRLADGIWLIFIGWFLTNTAKASLFQAQVSQAIAGIKAAQVMSRGCPLVPPEISLSDFVTSYLALSAAHSFVVGDAAQPRGLITLNDVQNTPREAWQTTSVQAAMRPWEKLDSVAPEIGVAEVLRLMETQNVEQVPVVKEGQWLGIIGREDLLNLIRNRVELAA